MARSTTSEAVVLRSFRLGEADRILHVYTQDRGRVGAVAKGVRKTKSRFGARLEPFSHVELVLHQGRGELETVTGASLVRSHDRIRTDPYRLQAGMIGLEAMLRLFTEQEANDKAFTALTRFLDALDEVAAQARDRAPHSTRSCSRSSSSCCGSPATRRTSRRVSNAARPIHSSAFLASAGGGACSACDPGGIPLSPEGVHGMRVLLHSPIAAAATRRARRPGAARCARRRQRVVRAPRRVPPQDADGLSGGALTAGSPTIQRSSNGSGTPPARHRAQPLQGAGGIAADAPGGELADADVECRRRRSPHHAAARAPATAARPSNSAIASSKRTETTRVHLVGVQPVRGRAAGPIAARRPPAPRCPAPGRCRAKRRPSRVRSSSVDARARSPPPPREPPRPGVSPARRCPPTATSSAPGQVSFDSERRWRSTNGASSPPTPPTQMWSAPCQSPSRWTSPRRLRDTGGLAVGVEDGEQLVLRIGRCADGGGSEPFEDALERAIGDAAAR